MEKYTTISDLACRNKIVLLRCDLNVPMKNGQVSDMTRIERTLPTIKALIEKGAKIVILSHFGRPKGRDVTFSLEALIKPLSEELGKKVAFASDCIGKVAQEAIGHLKEGDVLLLENVRFYPGEEKNDPDFTRALAAHGDFYVNDAFSCAHRAHSSTEGLAHFLPSAAGLSMEGELYHLAAILENPQKPVMAMIGGAKISTKLDLLHHLCEKMQIIAIGGGMANTFLLAQGHQIGTSLAERDMIETASAIMKKAAKLGCRILLPEDAVVAQEFREGAASETIAIVDMKPKGMILDIGPRSIQAIKNALNEARSLVWNGPLGAFEIKPFDNGTNEIAAYAAKRTKEGGLISVAGGGDTVAALGKKGDDFTYISTAGGAFLEWLEGKELPGVVALRRS